MPSSSLDSRASLVGILHQLLSGNLRFGAVILLFISTEAHLPNPFKYSLPRVPKSIYIFLGPPYSWKMPV